MTNFSIFLTAILIYFKICICLEILDISTKLKLCRSRFDKMSFWLAVTIGNSRWHWGLFANDKLLETKAHQHLTGTGDRDRSIDSICESQSLSILPVCLISVVPQQTKLWLNYQNLQQLTLDDIPLRNIYPTMGIDRAMAVWGAGETYNYPCLVIDGGTALTFTGVNENKELVGGAILPGLRSQLVSLHQKTSALPQVILPECLPTRWALNTNEAIASGIIYTVIAGIQSFIKDWYEKFPQSAIILTGGDADLLLKYLQIYSFHLNKSLMVDRNLIFWGTKSLYHTNS